LTLIQGHRSIRSISFILAHKSVSWYWPSNEKLVPREIVAKKKGWKTNPFLNAASLVNYQQRLVKPSKLTAAGCP
jgi:hypothetical protein